MAKNIIFIMCFFFNLSAKKHEKGINFLNLKINKGERVYNIRKQIGNGVEIPGIKNTLFFVFVEENKNTILQDNINKAKILIIKFDDNNEITAHHIFDINTYKFDKETNENPVKKEETAEHLVEFTKILGFENKKAQ